MSFVRRSIAHILFHAAIVLLGMAVSPRFDWAQFFRSHGLDPDCEPRFPLTEFDIVDGRAGWQWLISIKSYLDWRSGRDWQNYKQRRELKVETEYYARAINFLNTEVRHFGDAIPRAVEKKKPESAKVARAAKAGAR